jgi:DnaJ-class molecular chaperone
MSSSVPTHYEILELSNNASVDEIKKSYRRLSLQNHPDRNPSPEASEKIRLINTAYECLKDSASRRSYDEQLLRGGADNPQSMFFHTNFTEHGDQVDFANINNIFHTIFGNKMNAMNTQSFHDHFINQLNKPPPIVCKISITPIQSYNGCSVSFEYQRLEIIEEDTPSFGGKQTSRQTKTENISIVIPEGVENGEIIILRERGNTMNNLRGDVKICIGISENAGEEEETTVFQRIGLDLLYKRELTLKESLCGFSFIIKHLNGSSYCVKNKTTIVSPGQKQIIPNLGFKQNGNIGNLIIEYSVVFPKEFTQTQIDKLNEII